jgi:hypothetical protein
MIHTPLKGTIGLSVPHLSKINNHPTNPIKFKNSQLFQGLRTIARAAADNNLPDDHSEETQFPKLPMNQPSAIKIDNLPPIDTTSSDAGPIINQATFSPALREMELLGNDVSARTIERWTEAYMQMSRDAQELGIPASVIPPLPASPTKDELRQARDHLDRMMQSFLSAGL